MLYSAGPVGQQFGMAASDDDEGGPWDPKGTSRWPKRIKRIQGPLRGAPRGPQGPLREAPGFYGPLKSVSKCVQINPSKFE